MLFPLSELPTIATLPPGGIIRLIERFYDVNKGEILIDDVNIKEYNLYQLRKKIGLISQEPVLFKRKIYENILYGDLTAERNQVFEAADKAFISKMLYNKELKEQISELKNVNKDKKLLVNKKEKQIIILKDVINKISDALQQKNMKDEIFKLDIGKLIKDDYEDKKTNEDKNKKKNNKKKNKKGKK